MTDAGFHESPHLTETEARQALRGRHVFWMLATSLGLAIVALAAVWGYRAHDLAAVDAGRVQREAAAVRTMDTPPASAPSRTAQGG